MQNDRSTFTDEFGYLVDEFDELQDLRYSDLQNLEEYRDLKIRKNDGQGVDQSRLDQLEEIYKNKIITSSRWNKFQSALVGMQKFIKNEVEGYIQDKQDEFEDFIFSLESDITYTFDQTTITLEDTRDEFVIFVDGKKIDINQEFNDVVDSMRSRRDFFTTFVNTKEDQLRSMVQEFDSNAARYYQYWDASEGQVIYNIYDGNMSDIPAEANLNIRAENIDLVINGTLMRPYADYVIVQDGNFDKISLTSSAANLIDSGTEVVARWFKNVGKLYFSHASSHERGSSDELRNIDYRQFNEDTRDMLVEVSSSQPDHGIWFKEI